MMSRVRTIETDRQLDDLSSPETWEAVITTVPFRVSQNLVGLDGADGAGLLAFGS